MKNKLLPILLGLILLKSIAWLIMTPIFQIPDEPSHFSFIQFIAENNRLPHPRREYMSTQELMAAAKVVKFDWQITHPVWQGYADDWQTRFKALTSDQSLVINPGLTSFKRPVGYYAVAALVYRLFDGQPFLWRFFAIRVFSLLCQLVIVWLVYLTAQKLFKNNWLSLAAAAAVGFHPGFSFVSSGISYETLADLIVTVFIYLVATKAKFFYLVLAAAAGIFIKPDLIFLSLLLPWLLPKKYKWWAAGILLGLLLALGVTLPLVNQVVNGQFPRLDRWLYVLPWKDYSLVLNQLFQVVFAAGWWRKVGEYLALFFKIHYHQIFAWYWGVFGWLEVTLPPLVYTLLKLSLGLSLFGLFRVWSKVKWLVFVVLMQAGVVIANDFLVFATSGHLYGIQGRYFYQAISAQMILFVFGLSRFIPPKIIVAGVVVLNLVGLYTLYQYFGKVW